MKLQLALLSLLLLTTCAIFAQDSLDVVHLKNGKVYRGQLRPNAPRGMVELVVGRRHEILFSQDEIDHVSQELPAVSAEAAQEYGRGGSIGIAIGGGGAIGVPFRLQLDQRTAWEIMPTVRPSVIKYENAGSQIDLGLMLATAFNVGMKKFYHPDKEKVIANGLFIRGGLSFGKYKESILGFGWASERFKLNNKRSSFVSELGPGLVIRQWVDDEYSNFGGETKKVGFILAWKIHWNSYLK